MPIIKAASGIEWNYYLEGEEHSQVLFFIHGWGVDGRIWRQQVKYFSQNFKVLSIDLPGHGQSSWQKVPLRVMAEDVRQVLGDLNISRLTVVASSLGGLLSFKFYETSPQVFERLILVGSMPKFSKSADHPHGLDVAQMRKLGGQLNTAYPSIINIFFRSLFTQHERESRRFKWLQKFRETDTLPMRQALAEYLDILEQEDLRHVLKDMRLPVQIINGFEDQICTRETVAYIQAALPQVRVDYFKQCGHFPFLSKPHEFNQVVDNFLKDTK